MQLFRLVSVIAPLAACAHPSARAPVSLHPLVASVRDAAAVPALGAAIVTSEGMVARGFAGVREAGHVARVDASDRWHLGSCTKTITATLVARLVDRGIVRWDTRVGDVFRDAMPMVAGWRDVTLLHLLTHRSGAPRNFEQGIWERVVLSDAPLVAQRRRLAEHLLATPPADRADSMSVYSNAAFILAGAMLEAVTGVPWETLVEREVFVPLGMSSAGFGPPGPDGTGAQARGHSRTAGGYSPVRGPRSDNPPVTGPAGSVHATLDDWARFIQAHLRGHRGDTSFLSRAQWSRLHSVPAPAADFSPGWRRVRNDTSGFELRHLGSNGFWLAQASVSLAGDFAVLLTANASDDTLEAPFIALERSLADSATAIQRRRSSSRTRSR